MTYYRDSAFPFPLPHLPGYIDSPGHQLCALTFLLGQGLLSFTVEFHVANPSQGVLSITTRLYLHPPCSLPRPEAALLELTYCLKLKRGVVTQPRASGTRFCLLASEEPPGGGMGRA